MARTGSFTDEELAQSRIAFREVRIEQLKEEIAWMESEQRKDEDEFDRQLQR